jgi:hypothetical protein
LYNIVLGAENVGETSLVTIAEVKGAKTRVLSEPRNGVRKCPPRAIGQSQPSPHAYSLSLSLSGQVKAAAAHVVDRNRDWEENILYPTIRGLM